jgi:hypothetical protein
MNDWPQEISRTKVEVTFSPTTTFQTVYHPKERSSVVREITETGRLWVQSSQDGPRDTVIPMTQVMTVVFWQMEAGT